MSPLSSAIALSVALGSVPMSGYAQTAANPAATAAIERGRVMFEQHCAVCHGKRGHGNEAAADACIRDLMAFIESIQQK